MMMTMGITKVKKTEVMLMMFPMRMIRPASLYGWGEVQIREFLAVC